MGHRAPLGAPLTYGAPNFTIDKPKVLRQFEKKVYYIGGKPNIAF